MATIIASSSFPTVEGTSRPALFKKLARATGLLSYGVATGGSGNTLIDTTRLKSHQYNSGDNVGGWIRISSTSGSAAPYGDIRPITTYVPDTGTLTVSPNFSGTPLAGATYEIWKVDPTVVMDIVDESLTDLLYMPCWTVLSEVPDYDMEQTGTSDWTASNATLAKSTSEPRSMFSGKRYLTVTSTTAGGYARSALLRVEPTKTYHASALARAEAASTTCRLTAWDETNGVEIAHYDSQRLYPVRIYFTFVVPATCYSVSLRLTNVENSVTTDWDEVSCYPLFSRDIALPWWVKDKNQVKGIFRMSPIALTQNIWDGALLGERDSRFDKYDVAFGRDQLRAVCRVGLLDVFPPFMLGTRNETAYTDDTEVKYIDPNLFMACVKYKVYEYMQQPLVAGVLEAANIKALLPAAEHDYLLRQQQFATDLVTTITSDTPMAGFTDARFTFGA